MKKIIIIIITIIILTFFLFADNLSKEVLNKNSNSVVQVINKNNKNYIASGVIVNNNFVITTALIINQKKNKLFVKTYNKKEIPASLIGQDYESSLALLKIKNNYLKPIKINRHIEVGDWVALIGSFYNSFPSIYEGIVSSKSENNLIINAPVVPGVSGGAIVDKTGALVGIIRGGYGFSTSPNYIFKTYNEDLIVKSERVGSNKLCYAIPVEKALNIINQLKKYGRVKRSFLGVYAKDNNGQIIIEGIVRGSSAEKYGLKKGDIIIMIGKNRINTYPDLIKNIKNIAAGEKFKIKIKRDGKIKTLSIIMGEKYRKSKIYDADFFKITPKPDISETPEIPKVKKIIIKSFGSRVLGIEVYELTPELAKLYKIKEGKGLLISKVRKGSAADKGGLKVGDAIVRVNGKIVGTVEKIREILNSLKDKEKAKIEFYRDKKLKKLFILPEKSKSYIFYKDFNKNIEKFKSKLKRFKEDEKIKYQINNLIKQMKKLRERLKKDYPKIQQEMKESINKLKKEIEQLKFEFSKDEQ